jgi:leukocyte elastase inhibitor
MHAAKLPVVRVAEEVSMHRVRRRAFIAGRGAAVGALLAALTPNGAAAQTAVLSDGDRLLGQAYNASGEGLFKRFPPGNVVFSPYSIGTAMAMALAGARGETEREMLAALKQRLSRPEIDAANAAVLSILNGYDKSAAPPTCPAGMRVNDRRCEGSPGANARCQFPAQREGELCVAAPIYPPSAKLSVADALMLTRHGGLVAKSYEELLKDKYAAEVFRNATLDDVNGWVSRKTQGKIDRILDYLEPDSAAVLLNAVYFKAKWAAVFSKNATTDEPFHVTPVQKVAVPMMRQVGTFNSVTRLGYRAVRLPYEVRALGMVIVLPDAVDGIDDVSRQMGAEELSQLFAALRSSDASKRVDLAVPRFKTSFKAELVKLFREAGITRAFNPKEADFSGMTGRPPSEAPFAIGQILHRAVIDVMEDGTEAAAVTAITVRVASAPTQQPEVFRVDRPFLFYVVDDATGAVLFQGRIVDPR